MPILLLSLFLLYFAYKWRIKVILSVVLCFYGIGAFTGYLMTFNPLYALSLNAGFQDINYEATIYILVCLIVMFYPLYKYDYKEDISGSVLNVRNLKVVTYIVTPISLLYCVYMIPHMTNAMNAVDFSDYKQDILMGGGLDISNGNILLEKLFAYQVQWRPLLVFLFFASLAFAKNNFKISFFLGLSAYFPVIFAAFGTAHRNGLVFVLLQSGICYYMMRKYLSAKVGRIIFVTSIVFITLVVGVVIYFAILRFDDGGGLVTYSLLRYLGEPFVNFNTMMWGTDDYLWGNRSFPIVRGLLGLDYIPPLELRDFSSNMKYINFYFYSIIGDFYADFGPIITLGGLSALSLFFNKLISVARNPVSSLLLVYFFSDFILENYFYFSFSGGNNINIVWYTIYILVIIKYLFK